MRIALVIDYSLDILGGAQRAWLNEAAALSAAGCTVLLVAPRPRGDLPLPPRAVVCWTDGVAVPVVSLALTRADDLRDGLVERFGAFGIDAVHVHSELGHATAAIDAARMLGLPVVHTVHTAYWPAVPRAARAGVRHALARLTGPVPHRSGHPILDHTLAVAAAADAVVSPSAHQAADLAALGVERVVVLPNCDDATHQIGAGMRAPDRASGDRIDGPLRVAWIGRCVPEKRLLTFVAGVRRAAAALPAGRLHVDVVGSGPALPVARMIGAGVCSLRFHGRLDASGVRAVIAASDLTALTSLGFDNQPMTVVESVRAGRGVLYTDPRLREGLDAAGLLTRSPGAAGIAELLVELATERTRVDAAMAGAQRVRALFDPARHAAELLALYAPATPNHGDSAPTGPRSACRAPQMQNLRDSV